jgi:hypothetical protein
MINLKTNFNNIKLNHQQLCNNNFNLLYFLEVFKKKDEK